MNPNKKSKEPNQQDNIGYENTETSNSSDERENDRLQASDADQGKAPDPDPASEGNTYGDNSGGLRADSSAKNVSGKTDKGKDIKSGKVDTKGIKKGK